MRYIVVGAGAIGGTVGARLAESGHDVVMVARGEHGAALKSAGLTLAMPERTLTISMDVVASIAELQLKLGDVLLVCVKSQDSAAVFSELSSLPVGNSTAGGELPVFCLQNGVESELIAQRYFDQVHGVCLMLPATFLEPGKIDSHGSPMSGILEIGRFPLDKDHVDEQFAAHLNASGFTAVVRENVMAWKRSKLLQNLTNALQPLCGFDAKGDRAGAERVAELAVAEGMACFAAAGLPVVPRAQRDERNAGQLTVAPVEGRARKGSSTWQSVARGAGAVETDFLNGEIVLLGRLHGVPTPMNAELQRQMQSLVHQRVQPESVSPSDLITAAMGR